MPVPIQSPTSNNCSGRMWSADNLRRFQQSLYLMLFPMFPNLCPLPPRACFVLKLTNAQNLARLNEYQLCTGLPGISIRESR